MDDRETLTGEGNASAVLGVGERPVAVPAL
jgi:hypothetical protein